MLPRRCKAVGLCRTSLFFAPRTLETAVTGSVYNATPDHLLPQAATSLQIHCFKRTTDLLCRQKEEQTVNIMSMEVVIISKSKYEEMVGKLNRLSDRVNEILRTREGKRLSRWMDNQEVCQQLRISPRTLQTLRDNGTRWLTRKSGTRFSTSRRTCSASSGSWRTDVRMQPIVAVASNQTA